MHTTNKKIELKIVGYDEPNNGRELHIAELYINGENVTEKHFKGGWNRLNFNLSHFVFESPDKNYVFIPAEGNSFVIDLNTMDSAFLPYKGISTALFQKNEFVDGNLIIYYSDEILEIHLESLW